jgi:hypothetical protein
LILRNAYQRPVVNRFHEAVAEGIHHRAQDADVFCLRLMLLGLWAYRPIVDERTPGYRITAIVDSDRGVHKVSVVVTMAHPKFCDLAGAPGHWILVAGNAGCRVKQRTKPDSGIMDLLEYSLILGERIARRP